MNRVFLFLAIFFIVISCKYQKKYEKPQWIIGKWQRINNEDSTKITYEIWNTNFSGISFTIRDKDTVFVEEMDLVEIDEKKYFQIKGIDGKPTYFEFTEETEKSFICENSMNQFPKKIVYRLEDENLVTKVANEDFVIDFIFEKKN